MPIYEYQCQKCKKITEITQRITDEPLKKCPKCKGPLERLISLTSFSLKGSGWYKTDYERKGKSGGSDSDSESSDSSDSKSDSSDSSDSKSESKGESEEKKPNTYGANDKPEKPAKTEKPDKTGAKPKKKQKNKR